MTKALEAKTISDFGEQWRHYTENDGYYSSSDLFADIIGPLLTPEELAGKTVVDIGAGTGRIVNMILAAGAARVHALEPAPDAFAVLRGNTEPHQDRIDYLNIRGEELPPNIDADYVLSIGVIHHIPEPDATVRACFRALRPGGRCLFWLYGKEGNEAYLRFAVPLRKLTVRLPHVMIAALAHSLNVGLDVYILMCRFARLPMREYMLKHIAQLGRDKRYLTIYDQLNPAYAKYYTQAEARDLLAGAGFTDLQISHRHGYSWTVMGKRPL